MSADRVLCVAEKPSVAKELAAILSQGRAQAYNTHSQFNRKFEFPYELDGRACTLVVTSVTGHIMERDFDESHRKWHTCEPIQLLDPSVQVIKMIPQDKRGLERNLLEEGRRCIVRNLSVSSYLCCRCGQLICFLDCDREGENISYEVIEICQRANPRIHVRRAHFSALIPRDIHRAMRTLTLPNQNLSEAVEARSEIDLRLGAAFTRFQTMVLGKRFEQLSDKLLSWGPCQFATLGFIVDRAWKIERFVPEDFWSFRCNLSRNGKTAHFDWRRGRLFDRVACTLIFEMLMEDPIATVVSVNERVKERWRPLPLSTVNLQTIASRKLRMSSEETMQIAEELYNKGYISYPRTETEKFKEGTNLQELISKQCESGQWGNYANELLAGSFQWPRSGQNDDQAHPPIHPTQFTSTLSGKQAQLYELVVRHFLACCSKNAIGAETSVEISIGVEQFITKGLMIKELNWLKVYPYERWSDKDIPIFTEGEQFEPTELVMTEGRTQAPPLLSEADLISLMDSHGIGTDATIAEHITKVQQRDYATKSDSQQFSPTSLGKSLVTCYEAIGLELARPHFRARMEQDMSKIAGGQTSARVVIEEWMEIMKPIFQRCISGQGQMTQEMSVFFQPLNASSWSQTLQRNVSRCGICSALMDLKKQRNGETRALVCRNCSEPFSMPKGSIDGYDKICPICNFQVVEITNNGKSYKLCPHCNKKPPAEQMRDGVSFASGFRCFECSDARCSLATSRPGLNVPIRLCFVCGNKQLLLKKSKISYYLGCEGYPSCKASIWLPGGNEASVLPTQNFCSVCQAASPLRLLEFKFKRGSVPPEVPLTHVGCVGGCDHIVRELLASNNRNAEQLFLQQGPPSVQIHRSQAVGSSVIMSQSGMIDSEMSQRSLGAIPFGSARLNGGGDSTNSSRNVGKGTKADVAAFDKFLSVSSRPNLGTVMTRPSQNTVPQNTAPHACNQQASGPPRQQNVDPSVACSGHQEPCLMLTSRTQANSGRQFYKCARQGDDKCNFFQWADEISRPVRGSLPPAANPGGGGGGLACFKCGETGHMSKDCHRNSGGPGGAGNGNACFKCGEPGHFSRDCPMQSTGKFPKGKDKYKRR